MKLVRYILDLIMKLFGTANEISVDASVLQKQITDLSIKVDKLSSNTPQDLAPLGDMAGQTSRTSNISMGNF